MTVNRVLLFPNPKGVTNENNIREVEAVLDSNGIRYERFSENGNGDYDAIIALGGDGTMLKASRLAKEQRVPIMSINFGTLGYMSGLESSELHMLSALKTGFTTEARMLIDISVIRQGNTFIEATALNEAVVARRADGEIASIELRCDNARVCDYRADGLIIATPTGSSAYAMSAGGPIIDTKLDAICVCPICPHSLSARALVFSSDSVIEAIDHSREDGNNILLADGRQICELKYGDVVRIENSEDVLELIKLKKDAFYEILYKKMS